MLSDLKYSLSKSYVAGGMPEVEAIAAADGAVANALGLTEAAGFDACTFNPLARLWGAQFGTARRLLGATHQLELLGAARRLEQATEQCAHLCLQLGALAPLHALEAPPPLGLLIHPPITKRPRLHCCLHLSKRQCQLRRLRHALHRTQPVVTCRPPTRAESLPGQ